MEGGPVSGSAPVRSAVYAADYYCIDVDVRNGVYWLRRTATPIEDLRAAKAAHKGVIERLDTLPRRSFGLIVDLRDAPSRNDSDFEETVKAFRQQLFSLFQRSALLVRTATGKMQLTRHVRSDGGDTKVFDDERLAVDYLRQK